MISILEKTIQLKYRSISFLLFFILYMHVLFTPVNAQFFFPSIETLKKNQVKSMKVYQKPIYFKGGSPEEIEKLQSTLDSTRTLYQVFYFNPFGKVDSTVYYPVGSNFQSKVIYAYDGIHLVENRTISKTGEVTSHWLLEQTPEKEFIAWSWQQGKLRSRIKSNADSIMIETLFYSGSDTNWNRAIDFNPETNTRIEHWRGENGAFSIETYEWFASNGQPKLFKHSLEKKGANQSKVVSKEKMYDLDSAGNVVNKYMGRFDNPYLHYNYYERQEKLKPMKFNEQSRFRKNELFKEVEVSTLYSFSGLELVYLYTLEYEYM